MKMKKYKTINFLVIVSLIVFLLAGCGGDSNSNNNLTAEPQANSNANQPTANPVQEELTITPTMEPTLEPTKEVEPVLAKDVVYTLADEILVDNDICSVKVDKCWFDGYVYFDITCENKTSNQTLVVWMDNVIVNSEYIPSYEDVDHNWSNTVAPGKRTTKRAELIACEAVNRFFAADEVKFTIGIQDAASTSSKYLFYEDFTLFPTGKSAETIKYPERIKGDNEFVLVDNEDISFIVVYTPEIIEGCSHSCSFYIENKTNDTIYVTIKNSLLNGISVNFEPGGGVYIPSLGIGALPHTRVYRLIFFESDELIDSIGSYVEEITFDLEVFDEGDQKGKTIFDGKMKIKVR